MRHTDIVLYKYKAKTIGYVALLSFSLATFHYALTVVFRNEFGRAHVYLMWPTMFFTMWILTKRVKGLFIPSYQKAVRLHIAGLCAAAVAAVIGQYIARYYTTWYISRGFWLTFAGDMISMSIISAAWIYARLSMVLRDQRETESRMYETLGKRLILNLRSLRSWEEIRMEVGHLFPDMIRQIEERKGLSPMQVRMLVYMKLNFSNAKIKELERISGNTLRQRKHRILKAIPDLYEFLDECNDL